MNLQESKQNNCLLGIYLYEMPTEKSLSECLYSICEQTKPVDVIIYTYGFSAEHNAVVKQVAEAPYYTLVKRNEKNETETEQINAKQKLNYVIVELSEPMNFAQIFNTTFNIGKDNGYEYISLAESEDSFSLKWFSLAEKFASENSEVGIFLPLCRNTINGVFAGLLNDAPWAEGMSEEAGKIDSNLLLRFNCVIPLGALYKISAISADSEKDKETGRLLPMKESLKLGHYYEFFLRVIYNGLKVMSVPRFGYEMRIVRKEFFNDSTCKLPQDITTYPADRGGISPDEGRFWFELAKKEYFFDKDRKKQYEPSFQA